MPHIPAAAFKYQLQSKNDLTSAKTLIAAVRFKSHDTVSEIIMKRGSVKPVPPHPGRNQQQPLWL
jgi:hypothetical protein